MFNSGKNAANNAIGNGCTVASVFSSSALQMFYLNSCKVSKIRQKCNEGFIGS